MICQFNSDWVLFSKTLAKRLPAYNCLYWNDKQWTIEVQLWQVCDYVFSYILIQLKQFSYCFKFSVCYVTVLIGGRLCRSCLCCNAGKLRVLKCTIKFNPIRLQIGKDNAFTKFEILSLTTVIFVFRMLKHEKCFHIPCECC